MSEDIERNFLPITPFPWIISLIKRCFVGTLLHFVYFVPIFNLLLYSFFFIRVFAITAKCVQVISSFWSTYYSLNCKCFLSIPILVNLVSFLHRINNFANTVSAKKTGHSAYKMVSNSLKIGFSSAWEVTCTLSKQRRLSMTPSFLDRSSHITGSLAYHPVRRRGVCPSPLAVIRVQAGNLMEKTINNNNIN